MVSAQATSDDSSGYLGTVGQEMILEYARTDRPVTGIAVSVYWQDGSPRQIHRGSGEVLARHGAAYVSGCVVKSGESHRADPV